MNAPPATDTLIDYPCAFPIKVMGRAHPQLAQTLTALVQRFDPDFDAATVEMRPSRHGNWLGLTFTITATSRTQLDTLYQALHDHPMVRLVL